MKAVFKTLYVIGVLLVSQSARAACEAEKAKWQGFVAACEHCQTASGAMGIGGSILLGPFGGLFSIPMALEAMNQDRKATIAKAEYDKCMERAAEEAQAEAIKKAIYSVPRDEEFYISATSYHQAWGRNDSERWRRVEDLENQAKEFSKTLLMNLEAEGMDLTNAEVVKYVQAEVTRINGLLDKYVREVHDINNKNLKAMENGHVKKCSCKDESCYGFYIGGYWEYNQLPYPKRKIQ